MMPRRRSLGLGWGCLAGLVFFMVHTPGEVGETYVTRKDHCDKVARPFRKVIDAFMEKSLFGLTGEKLTLE
jgi:hypothetical protein